MKYFMTLLFLFHTLAGTPSCPTPKSPEGDFLITVSPLCFCLSFYTI